MNGLKRRWIFREPAGTSSDLSRLDLPPLVERVLLARGLNDASTVQAFCDPKLVHLHDPSLLPGLEAAATRLADAVREDASIAIYGDYDVDGITATAILYHVIKTACPAARVRTYVPHRLEEGYGLNADALRQLRTGGTDLVVSVDCGITAVEPARVAAEVGLDLIVTDHHHLPDDGGPLPDALLVHPRLPGAAAYPFGDLAGAGVAFKLAWGFATAWCGSRRVSALLQRTLLDLLPLAALGTIADVVPLLGENRVLASYGLRLIKQTPLPGLRALIAASGLDGENIDSHKVGFVLGPRLNACGRMGHAAEAVSMLTDATADEAKRIAERLATLNRERQETERRIVDEATRRAEDAGMTGDACRVIVLADPGWHPGVVGIVCSRLVDRFGRPAVLLQRDGDRCKGSARSIDGYSIYAGLHAAASHLTSYGGHDAAAGLALSAGRLDAFTEALVAHANEHISVEQLTPALMLDCDADLRELDLPAVTRLGTLAPFGRDNRRPVVRVQGATLAEPPQQMGGQGKHLSIRIRQDGPGGRKVLRGVWWGEGARAGDLAPGMRLDVAVEPKINEWKGRVSVEAVVRDVVVRAPNAKVAAAASPAVAPTPGSV